MQDPPTLQHNILSSFDLRFPFTPPPATPAPSIPQSSNSSSTFLSTQRPPPTSSALGSQHLFSSQQPHVEGNNDDEDQFGIGPGISLDDIVQAENSLYDMPEVPPPVRYSEDRYLEDTAISASDRALVNNFNTAINNVQLEECVTCNCRWFNLNIHNSECDDCRKDRQRNGNIQGFIPLFGMANNLDPRPMPPHLPALTSTEEQLIAKVHVHMEMRQLRGQQYKYKGHICHFSVNVGRVFNWLPLLPEDLDIIIVKPPASDTDNPDAITRQFRKDYKVR
jgi:hypothetical protein